MPAATTPQRRNQPVRQAVPADLPTTVVSLVAGSAKATISRQSPQRARWSVTCARSESGSDFSAKAVSTSASGWRFDAFVGPCSRWRTILGRWGILAFGSRLLALSLEHVNIIRTLFLFEARFFRPSGGSLLFNVCFPRLTPLRPAQGKLWAAFLRRSAAFLARFSCSFLCSAADSFCISGLLQWRNLAAL